ncbi:LpxI family protein [Sulfitobacter aestuariivivens]|uniref:UDP-2,3-diacylglucosamine diphosphatase LpxI n=1 Tax=Sulfitobacter aestuariivivens TaxID=2766981 RepID=A0A927D119_9RHOB|nr:UDP-2,3-diacylglucosamine diphosphatase LpxI [Sulfitobacter aestuariivivens]MBD3663120.1 UDP-2,3-diacylglucosamine diphosphatase LpxI [Sulfitobacter aestuariivivens]
MSLALIAGRGQLPALVAASQQTKPLICAYEDHLPEGLEVDLTFRLETLGTLLVHLGQRGITEVCMAGGISRPEIDASKLDEETAPLVPLFQEALAKGDDGALRVVVDLFEKTGFAVRGAHDLAPHLLAEGGVYSDQWPTARTRSDAQAGAEHIAAIGPQDIGQACIVVNGAVVAMEDSTGTDALINSRAPFRKSDMAVLFKGPKPQQSRRVDLPTIGPQTIEAAAGAGLTAVVVDAGDVLVLDKDACTRLADQHGIVFWARTGA